MAELSKDTQAILGSLKAEQAAVQENNEIQRDVGVKLEKFGGMFSAIKDSMANTQDSMSRQAALANDAAERSKQQAAFAKVNDGNEKSQIKALSEIINGGFDRIKSGFDGIKSGFASLKSGVATGAGLLQKLAFGAAGLFVGYNLVKGFLDETTNGGFSRMEQSIRDIDWESVKTSAAKFSTALTNVSTYLDGFPNILLGLVGVGITNSFVRGAVGGAAGSLMTSLLTGGKNPGGDGPRRGKITPRILRIGIPGIIAGGIATLTYMYGDEAANWINSQLPEQSGPNQVDWGKKIVSGVSIIGQAATLGAMFGPPGILAMTALSTAYVLGREIYDWMNRTKDAAAAKLAADLAAIDTVLDVPDNTAAISTIIEEFTARFKTGGTQPEWDAAMEVATNELMRLGLTADQAQLALADKRLAPAVDAADFMNDVAFWAEQVQRERDIMGPDSLMTAASLPRLVDAQETLNAFLVEQGLADQQVEIELSRFRKAQDAAARREAALQRAAEGYTAPMVFNFAPTSIVDSSQKIVHGGNKGYIETNTFGVQPPWAGQNIKRNGIAG